MASFLWERQLFKAKLIFDTHKLVFEFHFIKKKIETTISLKIESLNQLEDKQMMELRTVLRLNLEFEKEIIWCCFWELLELWFFAGLLSFFYSRLLLGAEL